VAVQLIRNDLDLIPGSKSGNGVFQQICMDIKAFYAAFKESVVKKEYMPLIAGLFENVMGTRFGPLQFINGFT